MPSKVARRFNHLYRYEVDFAAKAEQAAAKMGKKQADFTKNCVAQYREQGNAEALITGRELLDAQPKYFPKLIKSVCLVIWKARAKSFCPNWQL